MKVHLNSSICGIFNSFQQFIILWIESNSKGTVNNSTCKTKGRLNLNKEKKQNNKKTEQADTLCRSLIHNLQTVNVRAKVNLADIIVLEHCGVASVGCVVSSTVVEGAASRKSKASIQSILFD